MRKQDAPPPGWYPDPEGGARVRYWEGLDWSDRYRAPPVARVESVDHLTPPATPGAHEQSHQPGVGLQALPRVDSQAIISEVRQAAREEAERAAQMFGDQARSTVRSVRPLISEYTDRATRWLKRIGILVTVLAIAYFLLQTYAQASLFDWIGDRIDNLTDSGDAAPLPWPRLTR